MSDQGHWDDPAPEVAGIATDGLANDGEDVAVWPAQAAIIKAGAAISASARTFIPREDELSRPDVPPGERRVRLTDVA
jgi:hypothetical protein